MVPHLFRRKLLDRQTVGLLDVVNTAAFPHNIQIAVLLLRGLCFIKLPYVTVDGLTIHHSLGSLERGLKHELIVCEWICFNTRVKLKNIHNFN